MAVKFCTKGCECLCQQCLDEHNIPKRNKSHKIIGVREGKEFIKRNEPPYPPCHRHNHQLMDMYCIQCKQPMCNTCSISVHDGHKRCELERQGDVCKIKLEQMSNDTDRLMEDVKQAMRKTKQQAQQAEKDIDDVCDNISLHLRQYVIS